MKSLKMMVYGFFFSVQFFTIIPVRREFPVDEKRLKIAVLSLPVLGLLIGCLGSLLLFLLKSWTPLSDVAVTFFFSFILSRSPEEFIWTALQIRWMRIFPIETKKKA